MFTHVCLLYLCVSTTLHYVTSSLVANWFDMLSIWVRTTYHLVSNIVKRNCHIYQMSNNTRFVWVVQKVQGCESTHWRFAGALLEELTSRKLQAKLTSDRSQVSSAGGLCEPRSFLWAFFSKETKRGICCICGPKIGIDTTSLGLVWSSKSHSGPGFFILYIGDVSLAHPATLANASKWGGVWYDKICHILNSIKMLTQKTTHNTHYHWLLTVLSYVLWGKFTWNCLDSEH